MSTHVRSSGPAGLDRRRVGRIVAVWAIAAVGVLLFASVTFVGPVVATLYGTHGIHLGDLVVLLLAVIVASRRTARLVRVR
ncbi:hypothetical protein [Pseudonocardia humida]|uniref:Uncharacterized protein n=1 Tax=Pseudonocardia humida TaxID=2800819 RepID=A0ABT1A5K7_9PSEU|nr:hypothetical protein [Pseudonocardia humida]MCO1658284.1 hypothetical protein [Pseudonocardia humida]